MSCGLPAVAYAQDMRPVISMPQSLSEQAEAARDLAMTKNQRNFFMLDKKNALIIAFEDGQEVFRTPVFLGKGRADDVSRKPDATPAGNFGVSIWEVENHGKMARAGSIMPFKCDRYSDTVACYALHPTLETPAEKAALNNPEKRALSNGCVRVPLEAYNQLVAFVTKHEKAGNGPRFLVLPQDESKTDLYLANISASPGANLMK